ncbi:unnamed protein product [Symbiodinium sp. CCMP2592]|nr:unnamed protein product [Symbiodinium sp. CCMP2592]
MRSSCRYTTQEALALHESVPPDHWCVTRSDLKHLRREVLKAIENGEIGPPDDGTDDFAVSDKQYGPSIYTVNRQYIMPVTQDAGKVSWALMRHPAGLECDLFISHAWQEGVFEFLSKVLHSWPRAARHAWCCMLANPQNLDIGALLQSPSNSPFALALQASTWVLVVPNRHCSIYTRLWCSYEAYVAHDARKTIFVARSSNRRKICAALSQALLAGLAGVFLALAMDRWRHSWRHHVVGLVALCMVVAIALASAALQHNGSRMALNWLGAFVSGFLTIHWYPIHGALELPGKSDELNLAEQRLLLLIAASFFYLMEVDRVNGQSRAEEAVQLRRGFRGSIAHATCSEPDDADRIHAEIGTQTEDVDYAIQVLLTAGMSTPTLRDVARAGVGIQDAGHAEIAVPFLALIPFTAMSIFSFCINFEYLPEAAWVYYVLQVYPILCRVALLLVISRSATDERCFIMKMMTKLVAIYLAVICPILVQWEWYGSSGHLPDQALIDVCFYTAMCCFSFLGMRGTLALPRCGPCLLQLFLGRCNKLPGPCAAQSSPTATDTDSDSAGSTTTQGS